MIYDTGYSMYIYIYKYTLYTDVYDIFFLHRMHFFHLNSKLAEAFFCKEADAVKFSVCAFCKSFTGANLNATEMHQGSSTQGPSCNIRPVLRLMRSKS